jgi:ribosomal protein S18 acetylase RimI-like enzyme
MRWVAAGCNALPARSNNNLRPREVMRSCRLFKLHPAQSQRFLAAVKEIGIAIKETASDEERAAIIGGLVHYNNAAAWPERYVELTVVSYCDGNLVGGLLAFTHWNWLFIKQLWVAQEFRARGLGRRLILAAEAEAVARGCAHAHCDTFGFQALPFYEKLGYRVFGTLEDYPPGHTRYFLEKRDLTAIAARSDR